MTQAPQNRKVGELGGGGVGSVTRTTVVAHRAYVKEIRTQLRLDQASDACLMQAIASLRAPLSVAVKGFRWTSEEEEVRSFRFCGHGSATPRLGWPRCTACAGWALVLVCGAGRRLVRYCWRNCHEPAGRPGGERLEAEDRRGQDICTVSRVGCALVGGDCVTERAGDVSWRMGRLQLCDGRCPQRNAGS